MALSNLQWILTLNVLMWTLFLCTLGWFYLRNTTCKHTQKIPRIHQRMDIQSRFDTATTTCDKLFDKHETLTLTLLRNSANRYAWDNDDPDECEFVFPMVILKFIYNLAVEWRWHSECKWIQFEENNKIMKVALHTVRYKKIGTAHVDGITVNRNEMYLFAFKYIKGSDMDAIIGMTDHRFRFKEKQVQSVGNEDDCFNWGFRYDGVLCYNNKHREWAKPICNRWKMCDIIHMQINTINLESKESMIRTWMNGEEVSSTL
eukprot:615540_1